SGGALVNGNGELIGINTAIATPTGYYAGYSFAVPINIVKKVADDILTYGKVKRGYLGVSIRDLDNNAALQLNITRVKGVLVESVTKGGAADKAGIKNGDVIIQVEDRVVNTIAELQEHIGLFHPNDNISIIVVRDTKPQQISVKLQGDK
ncbi:MAG TPA: PDZ domain-containing protein, partial [Chitinophagales bacterium]|nr:PDZ domain-containing protein [Chitinophagales bacterium]